VLICLYQFRPIARGAPAITAEQIIAQSNAEQKKTLGYFLAELCKRVDLDVHFDRTFAEFLRRRNLLAHHLSVPAGIPTPRTNIHRTPLYQRIRSDQQRGTKSVHDRAEGEEREDIAWSEKDRRRQMFRIAIALTVLLWGASAYADDEAVIAVGKAAVAAKLIDPDSAHFTDVHAITRNGRQFVCGHVAAKTRKGAYDAKPFVFISNEKRAQHSAIIYGGRSITDDRFSNLAQPAAFSDICGS